MNVFLQTIFMVSTAAQKPKGFFQEVVRSFENSGIHPTLVKTLSLTAGLIAVISFAAILWNRVRQEDKKNAPRREAFDALEKALYQRARIDVTRVTSPQGSLIIPCTLTHVLPDRLHLEAPAGSPLNTDWITRQILCFFRIERTKEYCVFYKFVSNILDVQQRARTTNLILPLPRHIELGQKRRHLRLNIPPQDILQLRVWKVDLVDDQFPVNVPDDWPVPVLSCTPEDCQLTVKNISGGGICLEYLSALFPDIDVTLQENPTLFLEIILKDIPEAAKTHLLVKAQLCICNPGKKASQKNCGYQFLAYKDLSQAQAPWRHVDPDQGIDILLHWVFRRHLELYREKEIG